MKHILVIAECINLNATSEGISTVNFLNALSRSNHKIDCLYYQFVQFEVANVKWISNRVKLIKIPNNRLDKLIQNIRRFRYLYSKVTGKSLIRDRRSRRFYKYINLQLVRNNYDLIFVRTIAGSIASHEAMLKISKERPVKWITYFNDPVPRSMMPPPYNGGNDYFKKETIKTEKLVKNVVAACSGISSPSRLLSLRILNFTGESKSPELVFEFPHVYYPNDLKERCSINIDKSRLNILHTGSLLEERTPEHLMKALKQLIKTKPSIASALNLTFIGNIHQKHLPLMNDPVLKDCLKVYNTRLPYNEVKSLVKEADILLIIEAISNESPFMPGKLADYIGLNKMIWTLSPKNSETRRLLGTNHPYQCASDDSHLIYHIILKLYEQWSKGVSFELNRSDLTDYVSPDHVVKEMNRILDTLE